MSVCAYLIAGVVCSCTYIDGIGTIITFIDKESFQLDKTPHRAGNAFIADVQPDGRVYFKELQSILGRIHGIGEIDVCIAETADRSIDIDVIKKAMLQQYPVRCPAIIVEAVAARTIQWRHQKVEFT